jgi:CDP-diacylglycerol--glycerol-3-phosphate 3-phosphatidyltransferase
VSIANYLTFIRICISPLFLAIYLWHDLLGISLLVMPYVLLFLLAITELSDAFDGYLARRFNQVTDLGKILDPMADSIARLSVFLTFTLDPIQLPMPLVFVFFYRDSMVSTLRTICALKGVALAARFSGKVKAVIQACAGIGVTLLLIPYSLGYMTADRMQQIAWWIVGFAGTYTVYSGIDYIYANRGHIGKLLRLPDSKEA